MDNCRKLEKRSYLHGFGEKISMCALWVAVLLLACCIAPKVAVADDGASQLAAASDPNLLATTSETGNPPSRFDLRDKGVVSPVKNQDPWGTCWAFATSAASETSIMSELGTTYARTPVDLSVRHLAWFAGTALPDSATMKSTPSQAPYASQAGEGTTVRTTGQNVFAHPLETGGFSFYAASALSAGMGPVSAADVPYKNDENMAEYVTRDSDPIAELERGQTLAQFRAKDSRVYHRFAEKQLDPDGEVSLSPTRQERVKATSKLASKGLLSHYALAPIFDSEGHFIANEDGKGPVYNWGVAEPKRFSRMYELEECRVLPQPTGDYEGKQYKYNAKATQAIKQELLAGRGVTVSIFDDSVTRMDDQGNSRFTNRNTWSQYTYDTDGTNKIQGSAHLVCIVGWDDNWGTDKFVQGTIEGSGGKKVSRTPPGPGAWIVKNSYGSEGAGFPNEGTVGYVDESGKHTGYFYLSYYDMGISLPTSFDYDVSGHVSDFINQYDLMPAPVVYAEKYDKATTFANVFTAEKDQVVHSLSVESELPNTHAKLELWRLADGATTPEGGEKLGVVEADFKWGGFHRLSLAKGCTLKEGERFAVVGQLTAQASGATKYQVPVHRDVNKQSIAKYGDKIETYVTGVVNKGESFLHVNGTWKDWSEYIAQGKKDGTLVKHYDYDNFSLKAYADAVSTPNPAPEAAGGKVGAPYKVAGSVYKVTSNDKMTVKLMRAKSAKACKVPAKVRIGKKAYKVASIAAKAFAPAKKKLQSVIIGKNVKTIGKQAFAGCGKLKTITVKSKLLTKKSVKNSLVGSSVKIVKVELGTAKANKSFAKKYAKAFAKKNSGRKVTVKG